MCPYQYNMFCLRNVYILYNTCSFLVFPLMHRNFLISTIHTINFVLVFLSDRATVCSICNCCCPDHCFIHLIFQLSGYPFFGQHTCQLFPFHPSYSFTRLLMLLSDPALESTMDPIYLNVVTDFSSSRRCVFRHGFWK